MLCTKRHFLDAIRWKAFTFFSVYENARDCIVSKALSKHLYIYSNPTLPLSEFMKNDFLITQYLNYISKNLGIHQQQYTTKEQHVAKTITHLLPPDPW